MDDSGPTDRTHANLHVEYEPPLGSADSVKAGDLPYHGEAAVDIVAVHGLASKYPRTWSVQRNDGSRYYWLRDKLPKDLPNARVLGFEYASEWYGDPSHTNVRECAAQLLRCLIRDRSHVGSRSMCPTRRQRPIIFIGHSFGGLVIKYALVLAAKLSPTNASQALYEVHRDLLSAVAGIVFLGTPHRGSAFSALAEVQMFFGRIIGASSHDDLVRILHVDSLTISDLQADFSEVYHDTRLSKLSLVCYVETKELRIPPYIVVPRESACLDYSANRDMNANHMEMAKFHEDHDQNYDHVLADIRMICKESIQTIPPRFAAWRYGSSTPNYVRERLLQWLAPSREAQKTTYFDKRNAHLSAPYTCHWIQEVPAFQTWGSNEGSSICITGKSGSGKSVLAAYLISMFSADGGCAYNTDAQSLHADCTCSYTESSCSYRRANDTTLFFFCGVDRANETPVKVLGTLIHQLLSAHDEDDTLFSMANDLREKDRDGTDVQSLSHLLVEMCGYVGPVTIVLDGLEENSTFPACAKALANLDSKTKVKFVFLSQDTPEISKALEEHFPSCQTVTMTEHTKPDIDRFAADAGAKLCRTKDILRGREGGIVKLLQDGAEGMFRWVSSASEYLEEEVEDPNDVEARLNELPSDLISTYEKIFERMASRRNDHRDQKIRTALQFLAASGTVISPSDLKTAISVSETKGYTCPSAPEDSRHSVDDTTAAEMKKLLGPMVEFPSANEVRLAHTSIRIAVTREDGNLETSKYKFSLREAHFQICKICMRICSESTMVYANAFSPVGVPLVQYAWTYWPYHFYHSQRTLDDHDSEFKALFDHMLRKICGSGLAYLEALLVFLCQPLRAVPGRFSDREYMLALKQAQESLLQPTQELCALRQYPVSMNHIRDERNNFKRVFAATETMVPAGTDWTKLGSDWRKMASVKRLEALKKNLLGGTSSVERIKLDEYMEKLPSLVRPSSSLRSLLNVARHLRVVALRFAVDPIFSALILTAAGSTFSPLHPLLYLAQFFEDCGMIPYWDILAPDSDVLEAFVCDEGDPEFGPAKFVLSCFQWREPDPEEVDASVRVTHMRFTGISAITPRPSGYRFTRVSTENRDQVRRLHQMPSKQYFVAHTVYATFKSSNDLVRQLVTNPLSALHMRQSLMVEDDLPVAALHDPNHALLLSTPKAVEETPLKEFLRAVPDVVSVYFVHYVIFLLNSFGRLSKAAMAVHWARLEVAGAEAQVALAFFSRFAKPQHEIALPRLRWWYLLPAMGLFLLRSKYLPSFGAYYLPHDWVEFPYAWGHPAAYLDLQNIDGFWIWFTTVLRVSLHNFIGTALIGVGAVPDMDDNPIGHLANIYGVFHHMCTIQRSIFAVLTVAATVVACALVMMNDAETLSNVWGYSLWWWLNIFIALFVQAAQHGTIQNGGGVGAVFALTIMQGVLIFVMVYYCTAIIWLLNWVMKPITAPAMFLWRTVLHLYIPMMKFAGVLTLLFMVFRAFKWTHKFVWDPYNIEGTLGQPLPVLPPPRSALQQDLALAAQRELGETIVRAGRELLAQSGAHSTLEQSETHSGGPLLPPPRSSGLQVPPLQPTPVGAPSTTRSARVTSKKPISFNELFEEAIKDEASGRSTGSHLQPPPTARAPAQPQAQSSGPKVGDEISPEELFRQFFGGGPAISPFDGRRSNINWGPRSQAAATVNAALQEQQQQQQQSPYVFNYGASPQPSADRAPPPWARAALAQFRNKATSKYTPGQERILAAADLPESMVTVEGRQGGKAVKGD